MEYKIAIIGGTGKAGRYIAKKALETGFQVRMLVRNPDRLAYRDDRIEIIQGDAQNLDSIRSLLKDCHIVVNTLGQPVKELPIYSRVTELVLLTMDEFGIRRYIGVTGASLTINGDNKNRINRIGANIFEWLFPKMMTDKKKELDILVNSNADWTLLRLPFVVEGSETGNIKEHLSDMPGATITNADIAQFIIHQVTGQNYIRKAPFISN